MKNITLLFGIILYVVAIFLPWGPVGSPLETGFNEEGSPGILGILPAIICFLFSLKSSRKSLLISLVIGVLMLFLPLMLIFRIFEQSGKDIFAIQFGVYLLMTGAILIIYGALSARKRINSAQENPLSEF